jgi:hypothetical protein
MLLKRRHLNISWKKEFNKGFDEDKAVAQRSTNESRQ